MSSRWQTEMEAGDLSMASYWWTHWRESIRMCGGGFVDERQHQDAHKLMGLLGRSVESCKACDEQRAR